MVKSGTGAEYQQEIANVLAAMFGTPDEPVALTESGLNQNRLTLAAGAAWNDESGLTHGLYRRHCVHCHGVTGDGRGPTARFLDPYPRDYRKGVFKFKSTYNPDKPTDADLHRILWNGAPGTSMPSFSLLSEPERDALVEYVKYLSIRGEMEERLIAYCDQELGEEEAVDDKGETIVGDDGEPVMKRIALDPVANPDQGEDIKGILEEVLGPWQEAAEKVVVPVEDDIPADNRTQEEVNSSIAAGRALFYGDKANCVKCHGPTGLGDGQQNDWDVWAKEERTFVDDTLALAKSIAERDGKGAPKDSDAESFNERLESDRDSLAAREPVVDSLFAIRNAIPRNLRRGVYRGGHRRIDIYHRVHSGIAGTPMPGVGSASPGAPGTLTDKEIWQLVDYVLTMPYEAASEPQRELTRNEEPLTR